jgi:hypothetical protein
MPDYSPVLSALHSDWRNDLSSGAEKGIIHNIFPTCFKGVTCCCVNISTFPGTLLMNIIPDNAGIKEKAEYHMNGHHISPIALT